MTKTMDEDFSPLNVVKKNLTDFNRSAYRVYKSPQEFVTVEAATALEAMRESGVQAPLKIVREIRFMDRMVEQNRFTAQEELVQTGRNGARKHDTALAAALAEVQAGAFSDSSAPSHTIVQPEEAITVTSPEAIIPPEVEATVLPPEPAGDSEDLSPEDVAALLGAQPNG